MFLKEKGKEERKRRKKGRKRRKKEEKREEKGGFWVPLSFRAPPGGRGEVKNRKKR